MPVLLWLALSMTCTRGRMAPGSRDLRTARSMFYRYAVAFIWIIAPVNVSERAKVTAPAMSVRAPVAATKPSMGHGRRRCRISISPS